ncbi:PLCL-like protein [Mya arenaria]|uniref:PLCL-like protein n=1 Tax=Mya arenaria TaxID=6604 RepID=A0ABY7DUB4_MYAAR|nr:PLCL-like protein [Mya arenaria]
MKLAVTLAFCFIVKVAIGNTVLQSSCQLDLETTVSKSLELLKNALGRGECPVSCPDGWIKYQGSCYLFGNTAGNFAQSEEFCAENGGYLVHINNSSENDFLKDSARERSSRDYWIGLTDRETEGVFTWLDDGSQLDGFTDWPTSQPDDYRSNEDCAIIHSAYDFKWNDGVCNSNSPYPLCERMN